MTPEERRARARAEISSAPALCSVVGCERLVDHGAGHEFIGFPICREHFEHGRFTYINGKVWEFPIDG